MNLLYVTNSMEVGGIETNMVVLARELIRQGHAVTVASSGGALVPSLHETGAVHVDLALSLRRPALLWSASRELKRMLKRTHFDVVHALSAAANLACFLAGPRRDSLYVSSPMGLQNSDRESPAVTWLRNALMVIGAPKVLVVSSEIRRAVRATGASPDRLVACTMVGIDLQKFDAESAQRSEARAELRVAPDEALVTTIGALHPRKSHGLFLEAASMVHAVAPRVKFAVVGEGPQRAQLEAQRARLGLEDNVVFTGQRSDVAALLAATDVYVKPGVVEGFIGITVLEAQAAGKPVIAFATEDVRAAIADGETGIIVPARDTAALAGAIRRLLDHPNEAARLGAAGQVFVRANFDLTVIACRLVELYQQLGAAAPRVAVAA